MSRWRGGGGAADILRWFRILLMSAELGVDIAIIPPPVAAAVPQTLHKEKSIITYRDISMSYDSE